MSIRIVSNSKIGRDVRPGEVVSYLPPVLEHRELLGQLLLIYDQEQGHGVARVRHSDPCRNPGLMVTPEFNDVRDCFCQS